MIVINKYEGAELLATVNEYDPNAFVTFHENAKVFGNFEHRL